MFSTILGVLALVFIVFSTSLKVDSNEGGLITKMFGTGLEKGKIVAANGERGVQADVLTPGWSFGWWPWLYKLESVKNIEIKDGQVGVVTAMDGDPLPAGEVYARAWDGRDEGPTAMLDAKTFLTKGGQKGPQLTVLPPGQYRYNPRLFNITQAPCVDIKIGHVGVVRANAGIPTSNVVSMVAGVALVPPGHKGLWAVPLMPGQYYMHPSAYEVIPVSVAKRVYSYTAAVGPEANTSNAKEPEGDNSIQVRTMDGYRIPVDVRVAVSISATNAPFVVARLGNPDAIVGRSAKQHDFDALEERSILPSLRAILRNSAEKQNAIEYVSARSTVEKSAAVLFAADMAKDQLVPEGFWLADIKIDASPEGQALLKTQTDQQLAEKQSAMYTAQVAAETKRGEQVKAAAMADMQKQIQESLAKILVASNAMAATQMENQGKATESLVYKAKVEAMGGTDAMTKLELTKMMIDMLPKAAEALKGLTLPQVVVVGGAGDGKAGNADVTTALLATLTSGLAQIEKQADMSVKAGKAASAQGK